jgi:hypothetical protein
MLPALTGRSGTMRSSTLPVSASRREIVPSGGEQIPSLPGRHAGIHGPGGETVAESGQSVHGVHPDVGAHDGRHPRGGDLQPLQHLAGPGVEHDDLVLDHRGRHHPVARGGNLLAASTQGIGRHPA